jgi:hypothetical protein
MTTFVKSVGIDTLYCYSVICLKLKVGTYSRMIDLMLKPVCKDVIVIIVLGRVLIQQLWKLRS